MSLKKYSDKNSVEAKSKVTTLQRTPRNPKGGNNVKPTGTRAAFIKAYEDTCGNVSLSCERAGIARLTYYRWVRSESRINRKFRRRLEQVKPKERLSDLIEGAYVKRVIEGSDRLIQFGLERKVKDRGWGAPKDPNSTDVEAVNALVTVYKKLMSERPDMTDTERSLWIRDLAEVGGVPKDALLRRIKIWELSKKL